MFTGIVQDIAKLSLINIKKKHRTYTFNFSKYLLKDLSLGESICINGCCLSIVNINKNYISFDIINETFNRTNLNRLKIGNYTNIEKSLRLTDRISGHLVLGHVLCTAKIIDIKNNNNDSKWLFKFNDLSFMKYIFLKNFIAIDGVSLTISELEIDSFCVSLIPDTLKHTIFIYKTIGDIVNIEIDSHIQAIVDTTNNFIKNNLSNIIK